MGLSSGEVCPTFSLCIFQLCISSVEFILGSIPSQGPMMLSVTPSAFHIWLEASRKEKTLYLQQIPRTDMVTC